MCDSCYRAQLEIIKDHEQAVPTTSDDNVLDSKAIGLLAARHLAAPNYQPEVIWNVDMQFNNCHIE